MSGRESRDSRLPVVSTYGVWTLFVLAVGFAVVSSVQGTEIELGSVVHVDGLTKVMWIAVTFFSGIVQSFSRRYMAANRDYDLFFLRILAFTVAVLVMTAADHVAVFVGAWTAMGLIMASLIGHVDTWPQARAARRLCRRYFLGGSVLLAAAVVVLGGATGETTITGILGAIDTVSTPARVAAGTLIVLTAVIQSAVYPFHRWLLSSMTAPTPSSALMHAGFVNAGGLLLSRLAPVVALEPSVMLAVAVIGALGSVLAQAMMIVQPNYKARLGCSTMAQMAFMLLQCGLGFFSAAVTHLVVHGFYKAYLFLSTGSQVTKKRPKSGHSTGIPSAGSLAAALVTAAVGGVVFAVLTGKGVDPSEAGFFLVVIVAVSVFHGTEEVFEIHSLSLSFRAVAMPLIMLPAFAIYAGFYNVISALMDAMPMIHPHVEMTAAHWLLLGLFVAGHLAVRFGWLRDSERLYVSLLNLAQADDRTVPGRTGEYRN